MAFFDDVKKTAKKAIDFTSKKTEELSDKVNIKLAIHSAESKIEEHYSALGKLVYDAKANGANLEADIASEIDALNQLKAELKDLEVSLAKADNKVFCASCGTPIDAGAAFCPACGAKVEAPAPADNTEAQAE